MKTIIYPDKADWNQLLKRPAFEQVSLEATVQKVMQDVQQGGDAAVKKYTLDFDRVAINDTLVSEVEFAEAMLLCSDEVKQAIELAKANIETFHAAQQEPVELIETSTGVTCWRRSVGIEKVGLYIPGGSAPLFSTILMLGIPAKLAACNEVVLCTPPDASGKINPAILYTAKRVGINKVFKIGGVQAIAAMCYGTENVPAVYKIFGPGNQYVTCAKQLAYRHGVAIDMPAGPSELAVLADETCVPAFVAADLLSQAEHGADSQVILVSDTAMILDAVQEELQKQIMLLPRKEIALQALENSVAFLVKDKEEAMDLLNTYAPEHLIIACKDAEQLAEKVINAGSVFLGNYSCESAGDYASGTNHTLPTNGYAKAYSGVSLDSFVKKITFQKLSKEGIQNIGPAIACMAAAEGLQAHKHAVTIRMDE